MRRLKKLTSLGFLILYVLFALMFLRGVLWSKGIFMGGDWGLPLTRIEMQRYFTSGFYTWSDRELFGTSISFLNALPFQILIGLLAKWGITGDIYSKFLVVFALVFPAISVYAICRFFNCGKWISFLGGFLFMTMPIVFNYIAMGWLFVLISIGILPWFIMSFIKSVHERKLHFAAIAGILYSLAMVQSQSAVWYALVLLSFIPYIVRDKKTLRDYILSFLTVIGVFLVLNAYWYLPLFLGGGSNSLNTNLAASTISLGTWSRLSSSNMLRLWGSLFNEQYESSTFPSMILLTFIMPFVAYSSLYILKNKRLVCSLVLLSLVPIILFKMGPGIIVRLPFSDLIRDIARFLILSSFATVLLVALTLDAVFRHFRKPASRAGTILVILLIINTYPFWVGALFGKPSLPHDVRLRTYDFSSEFINTEQELSQDPSDAKVLFLPVVGEISLTDDKRFYGTYRGIRDIIASYSPKPGIAGLSDRVTGMTAGIMYEMAEATDRQTVHKLAEVLPLMGVKYIMVRKNMAHPHYPPGKAIANYLMKEDNVELTKNGNYVSLFINNEYLPHLYIPGVALVSDIENEDLLRQLDWTTRPVVYYSAQNTGTIYNNDRIQQIMGAMGDQGPVIEYRKINPTKYRVVAHNVKSAFPLVYSESYSSNWKVFIMDSNNNRDLGVSSGKYISENIRGTIQNDNLPDGQINETWSISPLPETAHLAANGYANSWIIDPGKICGTKRPDPCRMNADGTKEMSFVIEFLPQRYFYMGEAIAILGIIFVSGYILTQFARKHSDV